MRLPFCAVPLLLTLCPPAQASPPPEPRGPRIEVAFALDATGSMGPHIDEARRKIRAIANDLATGEPRPEIRFGLVAFRDVGDEFVTRVHPFSPDIGAIQAALDATKADGGGDTPEAVNEGIRDALTKLAWTPPADTGVVRLVYVIGDAPAKHYPDTPTEAWLAAEARRRRISVQGIVCGPEDGAAGREFEALARHTEGRLFSLAQAGSGGGAAGPATLAGALSDTTKAYSGSVGVRFGTGQPLLAAPLAVPPIARSGLLGGHARWALDPTSFREIWMVHTSLLPSADRPPPPEVDFAKNDVLVVGGQDAALEVAAVVDAGGKRAAKVRPGKVPGPSFVLVPRPATAGKGS